MYLKILLIIFIIVFLLFISGYFLNPKEFLINQATAADFQFSLLYEKHPIVIEDPIVNHNDLLKNWFNFNYVKKLHGDVKNLWDKNRSKYLFIQSKTVSEILISRPQSDITDGYPSNDILCIKLKPNQVAIIPFRWYIMFNTDDHIYYQIDDYVTSLLKFII